MRAPSTLRAAPFVDAVCLVLFVILGRDHHQITGGLSWFFTVFWPIAVGWFAVALATRLYTRPTRPWIRLVLTWSVGLLVMAILRGTLTDRQAFTIFTVIAYGFIGLTTFGWRAVYLVRGRLRPRAPSAAPADT